MRKEAEQEGNKIKKQNARLRNHAIFDKSIENPMNKVAIKFVTTRKQFLRIHWRISMILKISNESVWSNVFNKLYIEIKYKC